MSSSPPSILPPSEATQIAEEPSPHTEGACVAQLKILTGAQLGRIVPLTRPVLTLGRSRQADIVLPDASVSKVHACVRQLSDGYTIEDLGGRNGTRVDGEPVIAPRRLRSGNRIQLGRLVVQFSLVDQLERRVRRLEHLEVVDQVLATANQELGNMSSVLACGLSQLLALDPTCNLGAPEVRECLVDMQLAASRTGELTQRLGTLVRRPDDALPERIDLSKLCNEVLRVVKRLLPAGIEVVADVEPGLWVDGDRAWLQQLLMSPCLNARDAMPIGGVLRLEARQAIATETNEHAGLQPGSHVLILIADTGEGIEADVLPRVFEPFFTTKRASGASGLGLTTVARVANDHAGSVRMSSRPGSGARLRILLPRANAFRGSEGPVAHPD